MIRNNLKIAWRNLLMDRQFTFLNVVGLSTGLACTFLIYLWVSDEIQVDRFHEKDSRLYQVLKATPNAVGTIETYDYTQGLLAQTMASELPEVEHAVAVRPQDIGIISIGDKHIKARSEFVSQDFFKIFSYKILEGDKKDPMADKYGVIISDQMARKLFNTAKNVTGRTISWNRGEFNGQYRISGVVAAPPPGATDQFDLLFTYELYATKEAEDIAFWGSNGVKTYLLLKDGTDIRRFNSKIRDFTKEKIKALYKGSDLLKWEGEIFAQRYSDRYLYNRYENGVQAGGRIEYVRLFSLIALFILGIACINFMNLSTAKASRRMKEVGIKKVIGAGRMSLILQYMIESMLMAFVALLIASALVSLLLPAFKTITGKEFNPDLNINIVLAALGITLLTGLVAGSYPALYLSGFKPVAVLKGRLHSSTGESRIRKGLVVFQFSISVVLIVSVLVVYRQMKLIQTTDLGYNKDNIVRFSNDGELKKNLAPFLSAIRNIPGVINATDASGDFFGNTAHSGGGISWEGKDPNLRIEYYGVETDYAFLETMGLHLVQGHFFSPSFGADSNSVIFNETAIAAMGLKDPVGKTVSLWGKKEQIAGVVKDFHFESLYKKIGPAFITFSKNNDYTLVKIKAGREQAVIATLEKIFKDYNQGVAFEYKFLDDDYQALYASEQRVSVLSRYFAGIAVLISCLGLFGLAAFTAQKRQKEIGIRKVVGASVTNVAILLSADFLKLVFIALLIAVPFSWWITYQWLQGFAYRIRLDAGIFVVTVVAVLAITFLTISFQTIRAALANPVKSLRTE